MNKTGLAHGDTDRLIASHACTLSAVLVLPFSMGTNNIVFDELVRFPGMGVIEYSPNLSLIGGTPEGISPGNTSSYSVSNSFNEL